jgi:hypothetical protein
MKKIHLQQGGIQANLIYIIIGFIVVMLLVVVVSVLVSIFFPPSSAPPANDATNTCFTYSLGVMEFQCGDNKIMGPSFGVWDCKAQIGAHTCK